MATPKSLVTHPTTTTHQRLAPEVRAELGIFDNSVRLSIGLEDVRDLKADLDQALTAAKQVHAGALLAFSAYATFRGMTIECRTIMCRNIKTLHNFEPPASEEEIYLSSLQFVRKLSGFTRPSKANQLAFDRAVDKVSRAARELIDSLVTTAPPRDREVEAVESPREVRGALPRRHDGRAAKAIRVPRKTP